MESSSHSISCRHRRHRLAPRQATPIHKGPVNCELKIEWAGQGCVWSAAMAQVVLFDIDGTLISTGGAGVRAFGRVFETEFGVANACANTIFAGRTDRGLASDILSEHGLGVSGENIGRIFRGYLHWLEEYLPDDHHEPLPGVRDLLAGLRALSAPPVVGLLTGNHPEGARRKLEHFGLWDEFAWGAFGDIHEDRDDVARYALELAREQLGAELNPGEILIVGDTERDIQCARAIGARVLAVATGNETAADLGRHNPDLLVNSLVEVCAADL
ncbi:MAG: hydrolase [Verrucomicrobiales bacterium]|nr:hydrolase [Verrucomicrobiales bacterium]